MTWESKLSNLDHHWLMTVQAYANVISDDLQLIRLDTIKTDKDKLATLRHCITRAQRIEEILTEAGERWSSSTSGS